ncbi:MAG: hypothetical protein WC985_03260 [Thermoplasmata archaeon]
MPTATVMASPQTHAGLLTATHRLAAAYLNQAVIAILADRVALRRLLTFAGDASGLSSTVLKSLYMQMGAGIPMENPAENGALTPITITADYRNITLGRHGFEACESWLPQITGRPGIDWDLDTLATQIADTFEAEFSDSVATLIATFASGVGTSGVDASMDDLYDATYAFDLQDGVEGPLLGVLHGRQIADLKESKRGEPADWIKDESQVAFKAPGYQGELIGVSMFKSGRVTSDGTDRWGAIFTPRAIGYAIAGNGIRNIRGLTQNAILIPAIGMILDFKSDGNLATSTLQGNDWYGMAIGDQGDKEGRYFRTDA